MNLMNVAKKIKDLILSQDIQQSDYDIIKVVNINEKNLNIACIQHPKIYAFWAAVYRISEDEVSRIKFELERKEADIARKIRENWIDRKKYTEAELKQELMGYPDYQKVREKLLDAEMSRGLFKAFVNSLEQRKDMLFTLTATERREMDSSIEVKERQVKELFSKKHKSATVEEDEDFDENE